MRLELLFGRSKQADTVGDSYANVAATCLHVGHREKQIGGLGGSLEPPGPLLDPPGSLLTHLHTVYMAYLSAFLPS